MLLVLGHHGFMDGIWREVGWAGVDLFFVLSGFLISGLLFSEYKKTENINLRRFFIRRGFKIYPGFWVMLLGSILIAFAFHKHFYGAMWLHEILFVQNYLPGIWRHTWSLAVEEHFYIVLPLFLLAMCRLSKNRTDPFWFIPYAFCILAPATLAMRYFAAPIRPPTKLRKLPGQSCFQLTCEIDSLFFGVVLGYFYHFHNARIVGMFQKRANRLVLEASSAMLLGCVFGFAPESPFIQSFGLTLVYLGFGGLLMLCLTCAGSAHETSSSVSIAWQKFSGAFAFVGVYSYSIYLWHIPVQIVGTNTLNLLSPLPLSPTLLTWVYIAVSIPFGILMARFVEFPVLRLRDRLFPRVSQPVKSTAVAITDAEARLRADPVLT